ncbi:GntR family transcriptional regulator, transcriptional repressor for pyruvate dehydrogenase complex [Ruminococcus flavefaciens]|jgi:GntR family transcriptional repressor for pyruvate dehydrogenase complex|uniref:GntR family transcriptional regulator, transcriptional repressor for pyruvate dehydrogenase complex n=1 Tax=Ruminococcus flavefaciens TaxID=1265 RepID=A0A1H6I264_RUMFL|nr:MULTISPECIES: GntR family transcriptional regulator [Ruminococcus]SEH42176.1 GntR family transcriptional regulator, transcriptional repressor for pyruvate dehydrogenase complex [Ruminococcus flavefaciens]
MGNSEYRKTIDYILDLIRGGMLQVGDKLPTERSISEKLGISRNTVREALRGLEILGIVNGKQGSGNYLTDNISESIAKAMDVMLLMNRTTKEEICSFRRSMEKTVCSYLIGRGCSNEHKLNIVAALNRLKESEGTSENSLADRDFHYSLIYATENSFWITFMNAVSEVYMRWIDDFLITADHSMQMKLQECHEKMVQGIITSDTEFCLKAIDAHYDLIDDGF